MKTRYAVAMGMMLMSAPAMAADNPDSNSYFSAAAVKKIVTTKVIKNYRACLRSENDGVVESALAQVAYVKLVNPEQPMEMLIDDVNRQVLFGRTTVIRYKAYLTAQVFDSPELFRVIPLPPCNTCDELFQAMSSTLHQALAGDHVKRFVLAE